MYRARICLAVLLLFLTAVSSEADVLWATFEVSLDAGGQVQQGNDITVGMNLTRCDRGFGRFEFLVDFDTTALVLRDVTPGTILTGCQWEIFSWHVEDGRVRVTGAAEDGTDPAGATCYSGIGTLAFLNFTVKSSVSSSRFVPVHFYWNECRDNVLASLHADTLYYSDNVYEYNGAKVTGQAGIGGTWSSCIHYGGEYVPARWVEYRHGGVEVQYVPPLQGCDPNNNGTALELADVMFLLQYIFTGGPAPDPLMEGDCNCDGRINIIDATRVINFLFHGGEHPCPVS